MAHTHKLGPGESRHGQQAVNAPARDQEVSAVTLIKAAEHHNAQPVWLAEGPEEEENKRAAENTAGSSDEIESEGSSSLDDALGLYLRQMGAIPLLTRQEELELAQRLDRARAR